MGKSQHHYVLSSARAEQLPRSGKKGALSVVVWSEMGGSSKPTPVHAVSDQKSIAPLVAYCHDPRQSLVCPFGDIMFHISPSNLVEKTAPVMNPTMSLSALSTLAVCTRCLSCLHPSESSCRQGLRQNGRALRLVPSEAPAAGV